jgi:hypothetical protein
LPPQFRNDDVRFSEQLVEHFLQHFTQVGDVVFDPFAGFGTTLLVAEALVVFPLASSSINSGHTTFNLAYSILRT